MTNQATENTIHTYTADESSKEHSVGLQGSESTSEYTTAAEKTLSLNELEQDIEATQDRIQNDMAELANRFNPSELRNRALETIKARIPAKVQEVTNMIGTNLKEKGSSLLHGAKENPWTSVLIGSGLAVTTLGIIMASRGNHNHSTSYPSNRTKDYLAYQQDDRSPEKNHQHRARELLEKTKEVSSEKIEYTKSTLGHWFDERPLVMGAVAIVVGAALGLALPRTSYEDNLLGDSSDDLINRAKETVGEAAKSVQETVKQTTEAVKTELSSNQPAY
jgi:ElaB/YqjD/DUF883 family membrane-anchored ribosome-binding protein